MLKKNWIKKRLNNIEKNNLELLKFKFLKETISTNSVYFDSPLHFLKPENYSDYQIHNENNTIIFKIEVNTQKLYDDWIKGMNNFAWDYILSKKYININTEYNLKTNDFINKLNQNLFLLKNNLISKNNIYVVRVWTSKIEKNNFNISSFEKDWEEFSDVGYWWTDKDTLNKEVSLNKKLRFTFRNSSDSLIKELLFKGNHEITIKYVETETEITTKGYEYKNSNWWKRNWSSFISIFISILALLFTIIFNFLN
ncbi:MULTISPECIES: hypothetical protein [unclassified Spiroplasma]|uniref:hypothetical protein n=1 Tax=unclassified Spiroplasma TaxID=2637901 RepID=UPI0030CBD7DF